MAIFMHNPAAYRCFCHACGMTRFIQRKYRQAIADDVDYAAEGPVVEDMVSPPGYIQSNYGLGIV